LSQGTREERPGECGLEISAGKVYHKEISGFKVCVRSFQKATKNFGRHTGKDRSGIE
jgi:hypothetical protein